MLLGIQWEIRGAENLSPDRWYIVNPNHQAWTDIPVLFTVFQGRIPDDLLSGDYLRDRDYKKQLQKWLGELWERKDASIEQVLAEKKE